MEIETKSAENIVKTVVTCTWMLMISTTVALQWCHVLLCVPLNPFQGKSFHLQLTQGAHVSFHHQTTNAHHKHDVLHQATCPKQGKISDNYIYLQGRIYI